MAHLKLIMLSVLLLVYVACDSHPVGSSVESDETEARRFMESLNEEYNRRRNVETEAAWAYGSNITAFNLERKNAVSAENAKFYKERALELRKYDYENFQDKELKRMFKKLVNLDYAALPDDKYKELLDAIGNMETNYAKVRVCSFKDKTKCDLQLEPELTEILSSSRDPEELKYYWLEWYNKVGTPTRDDFKKYVQLNTEAAKLNNFTSGAESWLNEYETANFEDELARIIEQMRPLYEHLHANVRYRLRKFYGPEIVSETGPLPMHLLGNMWGQTWDDIFPIVTPFPNKAQLDVTDEMKRQGYTQLKMFQMGDDFFQSLNMTKLPQTFWEKSILEKPTDGRDLVCHASAWDFYLKDDVRIKQCTRVNMDQFFVVHHELGHIQYYLQYQDQPSVFREGANPGFHEAVGDVLSLSVSSPKHLQAVGLLKDYAEDEQTKINRFYKAGLAKFAFLPFAYTLDKYRWAIFRGEIKPEEYNCRFWELRDRYSGIEPPVVRTEDDFDAAAKYHVSADVEYTRYLVSYVVQFQFHKAVCELAGEYVPGDPEKTLNNCDIYRSAAAGNAFKKMLSLGSSKPWPDAMEVLTGQRKMDASALLEYFRPLQEFLEKENRELGIPVGWTRSFKYSCPLKSA